MPEDKAQERSGGGFDASYHAQTAVDEHAHIVIAAELTNVGSDAAELPRLLHAVKSTAGQPDQFAAWIRSETAKWGAVVKSTGAKAE